MNAFDNVTIDKNSVAYRELIGEFALSNETLLGRGSGYLSGSVGYPEPITLGAGLTMTGKELSASGGGGGDVATDTIWDAKGDLAVATGPDAAIRVAVGSNDQVLMADSAQASGVKWAAAGVGDMVLASVQTVTGAKTFGTEGGAVGKLILAGSGSGTSILNAASTAGSTTLTLQGTTGTIYSTGGTDVAVGDGGTGLSSYTANNLIYASGTTTIAGLTTANSGVLVTSASGVPSIATDIPTAVTIGGQYAYRVGGTDVAVADGGTGRSTGTTAYALVAVGTTATGAQQTLAAGATTEVLVGGGASALPVWTTATGSGAPARATSPTFVTPVLGTPSSGNLSGCTGYVGTSALVTVGAITSGTWTSTDIAVADGGTGRSTTTAYAVICGGTTSTAAEQSIAGLGSSGQVLTSNGAGALPTFQAAGSGSGDVVGPASAVDNQIAVFSGTTGKLIKVSAFIAENSANSTDELSRGLAIRIDGNTATINNSTEPHQLTFNRILVMNDACDVNGAAGGQTKSNGFMVYHQFGGSSMTGGRHAIYGVAQLINASKSSNEDRNYVGVQGQAISWVNDNGTSDVKAGALIGISSISDLQGNATHFMNVSACEMNTTVAASTAPGYRSILQCASRDDDRGVHFDGMVCLSDISSSSNGLWNNGILIGAFHSAHPIRTTGSIMATTGGATIANGINLSSYTITGSVIKGTSANLTETALIITAATASVSLGLPGTASTPFIDFNSSANNNDYDSRIIASGGNGSTGNGALTLDAATVLTKELRPSGDNLYNLGTASFRWAQVYAGIGTINISDERKKEKIIALEGERALQFLNALQPRTFRFKDYTVLEKRNTELKDIPVTTDEEYEDDVLDGDVFRRIKKIRKVPVMRAVPVVDSDGKPVMEKFLEYRKDKDGEYILDSRNKPIATGFGDRPVVRYVPVTEKKKVEEVVSKEISHTHKRTHFGLIAQEVEHALIACGMTSMDFGGFIYDEESDSYGLRMDQFIAPLIAAVNTLSEKVAALKVLK